eukprot:15144_1
MSRVVTHQNFTNCFIQTHNFEDNVASKAEFEWLRLQSKWKLIGTSRAKWPQSFCDEARQQMNGWKQVYHMQQEARRKAKKHHGRQNSQNLEAIRAGWTMYCRCLFYLQSEDQWFPAVFDRPTDYNNLDLLTVAYTRSNREIPTTIQRSSPYIQPFPMVNPKYFQIGSLCEVCVTDSTWHDGIVDAICSDNQPQEWLKGRYSTGKSVNRFCIQRYSKDIRLMDDIDHFASLPLSLQLFIKWVRSIEESWKSQGRKIPIMQLDWNIIEQDLKSQCETYQDNTHELKEIYYDFRLDCSEYIPYHPVYDASNRENKKYFYDRPTIIHYILRNRYDEYYGPYKQVFPVGCHIIKLLLRHGIITGEELFSGGSFPLSILDTICQCLQWWDEGNVDPWIDLVNVICTERAVLDQRAIINVIHERSLPLTIQNIFDVEDGNSCKGPLLCSVPLCNKNGVLHKLLFRGIYPFQFTRKYHVNAESVKTKEIVKQPTVDGPGMYPNINDIKDEINDMTLPQYIHCLLDQFDAPNAQRNDIYFRTQCCILSPLVLHPFVCDVKREMFELLSHHTSLDPLYIQIIMSFIYINYDLFYPPNMRNTIDIEVIDFLNNISHLNMDVEKVNDVFEKRINDETFINYLFEEDRYTTEVVQSFCKSSWRNAYDGGGEILYKMITTGSVDVSLDVLYYVMISLLYIPKDCNSFLKFLQYTVSKFGNQFVIHHAWEESAKYKLFNVDNDYSDETHKYCIMSQLIFVLDQDYDETATVYHIIKYILKECNYDSSYDLKVKLNYYKSEKMTLLSYLLLSFNNERADVLRCLLIECKDKYVYSVSDICDCVLNVMSKHVHGQSPYLEHKDSVWTEWKKHIQNKTNRSIDWCERYGDSIDFQLFVNTIESCLNIRWKNEKDTSTMSHTLQLLNQWLEDEIKIRDQ